MLSALGLVFFAVGGGDGGGGAGLAVDGLGTEDWDWDGGARRETCDKSISSSSDSVAESSSTSIGA